MDGSDRQPLAAIDHVDQHVRRRRRRERADRRGVALGPLHELAHRLRRMVVRDADDQRAGRQQCDRHDVAIGVERDLLEHDAALPVRTGGGECDRVAVGGRLGHRVERDHRGGARPVLDDDRLADAFGDVLADRTRIRIGGTAGRKSDEDPDRLRRPGLRECGRNVQTGHDGGGNAGTGGERAPACCIERIHQGSFGTKFRGRRRRAPPRCVADHHGLLRVTPVAEGRHARR